MKAVIVAAGEGKRIASVIHNKPKCLLEINGKTLIKRAIEQLTRAGITSIGIVVGHMKDEIIKHISEAITIIENNQYASTNNMVSLLCAQQYVDNEEFIYLHSDIIMHNDIIPRCIKTSGDIVMTIDKNSNDEEAMKVRIRENQVIESSKSIALHESGGEWIGLIQFSSAGGELFFKEARSLYAEGFATSYDTHALTNIAQGGFPITLCDITGLPWVEIDFPEDYKKAQTLFINS